MDAPKTLAAEAERKARTALLSQPHVRPLTAFAARMRDARGPDFGIPDFDPLDGGVDARVLFLLEAPGPKAIASGFVSRNNPDETAKNFFLLSAEAGIDRRLTVVWNSVPWYIGSGSRIRPARRDDVREADGWLVELLEHLPRLRFVVFVGLKALHAEGIVRAARPDVTRVTMPHPSPMFVNRAPDNRDRLLAVLRSLADRLHAEDGGGLDERPSPRVDA